MIKTIEYKGKTYPAFQSEGNAAQFIMPFANQFCKGIGYDIGCNRIEWMMPDVLYDGSIDIHNSRVVTPIDPLINGYSAMNLPIQLVDFIFSSHTLEHIETPWYQVLEYWKTNVRIGGILFLYLPDYSQEYWRIWNNRKHLHIFTPEIMKDAFVALGMKNIFVSGVDMMNSFAIVGEVCHET